MVEFGLVGQTMHMVDERGRGRRSGGADADLHAFRGKLVRRCRSFEEVGIFLKGLWLLILGKSEGFGWLDISVSGGLALLCRHHLVPAGHDRLLASWRLAYLSDMPAGTPTGLAFIAKLMIVDLLSWIVPLLLVAALSRPLGFGHAAGALIVATNWLSVPTYYAMAVPSALRLLLLPEAQGLSGLLSLLALIGALLALFRVCARRHGGTSVLSWALSALLVLPSLMLGDLLQRSLGLLPG